jgi:2,3-bisphosphoglycerate-dependent phosphoglycerate mutase
MRQSTKLIMVRHGQSKWNKDNLFTGWVDIPLSLQGVQEAFDAGKKIAHLPIDVIFVSSLIRSQMTAMLALLHHASGKVPCIQHPEGGKLDAWAQIYSDRAKENCIPVIPAWELNERMYGKLQGMNKQEMREQFGETQVKIWRRSYDGVPPEGESLAMTAERAVPYFKEKILPYLKKGKNVFISAHGNSLRAIVMYLDHLTQDEVVNLEIATGEPLIYDFHGERWEKEVG